MTNTVRIVRHFLRHLPCDRNRVLSLRKDKVDIFQLEVAGLWVEEVENGHKQEVSDHKNEIGLPLQAINDDWRDHHDGEVPEPVRTDSNCCPSSSGFERENLRNIDPRYTIDAHAENQHV